MSMIYIFFETISYFTTEITVGGYLINYSQTAMYTVQCTRILCVENCKNAECCNFSTVTTLCL